LSEEGQMIDIDFAALDWLNPPLSAVQTGDALTVTTRKATDLWQRTFYGFRRDSGHFLYKTLTGDFTASVKFTGRYDALYDQAGLMVRCDETHWVKAGIEFTDGERFLSTVVTNEFSDWSVQSYRVAAREVSIRLTRHGEAIRVQFQDAQDGKWIMARLVPADVRRTSPSTAKDRQTRGRQGRLAARSVQY
jgi:regulation of enolase protein 1 (concanavalin A-like superfamily)